MLRKCNYPKLDEQIEEHKKLRLELTDLFFKASTGEIDKLTLHETLLNWWRHHILESDMQYSEFIQATFRSN